MHFYSLQSGSHGNCLLVESNGTKLLFDAGISGAKVERRLRAVGVDVRSVTAVVVSHDHRDHVQCAGILSRKFGIPVFMTQTTYREADARVNLGRIERLRHFSSGDVLQFGHLRVETIPTPHDAADGVAFVVDDGRRRLGILTDLGHPFAGLDGILESLDAVLLESNYDPQLLETGSYPPFLKARIRGSRGHLSNDESARLVGRFGKRLQWVCLGHLSDENNTPHRAGRTFLRHVGKKLPFSVAPHYEAGRLLRVA